MLKCYKKLAQANYSFQKYSYKFLNISLNFYDEKIISYFFHNTISKYYGFIVTSSCEI